MGLTKADRRRLMTEAIHSCLMESADVSDDFLEDAGRYIAGELSIGDVEGHAQTRNHHDAPDMAGEAPAPHAADPYLDPGTGILANAVGARTRRELALAEGELGACAIVGVLEDPPRITEGNLHEWCELHRRVFAALYSWAGRTRTVDIAKPGSLPFLPCSLIPQAAAWASGELASDHMLTPLKDATPQDFAARLAYHFDNYNYIHPFREGNGRAQRLLWTLVARQAGWDIDWRRTSKEDNDKASRIAAESRDLAPLAAMLAAALTRLS